MQCCPLEDFIWWNSCCCYARLLLLLSCYTLLHLALLCCCRKSGPLQPLTTHDLDFSCLLGARYWIWCISVIGLTQFGFFNKYLCPISHNALIMDYFSRAHLYGVPRVIVSSFGSEIDREKIKDYALSATFYGIPIRYIERELWRIYQGHFFEMNFRSLQKPWLPQMISAKMLHTLIWNFYSSFLRISASPHKNFIFLTFV